MSLDFAAFLAGQITYADLVHNATYANLRPLTDELFDTIQTVISDITDANVIFVARDPQSTEPGDLGWTLGHAIAHLTAILEDTAASAAMLARGVQVEGRLRYEIPWESIQTVQQLQERLKESHRMCNAFLDAWPDAPHLDITMVRAPSFGSLNAIGVCVLGVMHGNRHLDQIREITRQGREAISATQ